MLSTTIQNMFASHFLLLGSWLPAELESSISAEEEISQTVPSRKYERNVNPYMLE